MSKDILKNPQRAWAVSGQLQGISIQVFGDHPVLRPYVEEFIMPMVGTDGHAPLHVLEFSLSLLDGKSERPTSFGEKALVQFANVSCFHEGPLLSFHTEDGSFLKADVEAGRAWGHLSWSLLEAPRYIFTDLLLAPLMEMLKYRGFYGLHAAALTRDGAGYLFPGGAGSGKTSIALSLVKREFRYVADDKVLLGNQDNWIAALAFTRRFNIDPNIGRFYTELRFLEGLQPLPGSTKRPFDISRMYSNTFVPSCRPTVIVHLEKSSGGKSQIFCLSPLESFMRLVHQTIPSMQRDIAERQLKLFSDLTQGTENFLLEVGPDIYGAPDRLLELLPHL